MSEIDFSGKSFFSGTKNSFDAKFYQEGGPETPLYTVSGHLVDTFTTHNVRSGVDIETYKANAQTPTTITVADQSCQQRSLVDLPVQLCLYRLLQWCSWYRYRIWLGD